MKLEIIYLKKYSKKNWCRKRRKRVYTTLNNIEHFFILVFAITGCISISAFAFLLATAIGISSSTLGLIICAIAAGIKKHKWIIKKKKKKHDKKVLLKI